MQKKNSLQQNEMPVLFDVRIESLIRNNIFLDKNFAILFIDLAQTSIEVCLPKTYFDQNDILVQIEDHIAMGVLQNNCSFSISQKIDEILKKNEGCNIGVAISPIHGKTIRNLTYNAFQASMSSKQKGRGVWEYYNENQLKINKTPKTFDHLLYASIKRALVMEEFFLEYQGQVHSKTGALVGVEALIRWHPGESTNPIPPGEFIPFANKSDLIFEITEWVLKEACRQGAEWQRQSRPTRIAVNLSPKCLLEKNFIGSVEKILDLSGLPAELLELEITETDQITDKDIEPTNKILKRLQKEGIKITLDDFGKDHSFLKHLSFLSVDKIKIDRQFIASLATCDRVVKVVHSIINMSKRINIECLAEGVETVEQAARLEKAGCFLMQGFLWHRPGKGYPDWQNIQV